MRVGVVGAGIVGLAATYELARAGAEVRCFEAAEPMGARSAGETRIFRHAHADPDLVALAMRATMGWRRWERAAGRRLVGDDGTVVSGPDAGRWAAAMRAAGAPFDLVDDGPIVARLPSRAPGGPFLHDPAGGVIRARDTGRFLLDAVRSRVSPARVTGVERRDGGARVRTEAGSWDCDSVVIAAGEHTAGLAEGAGITAPGERVHHTRFTFRLRDPGARPPCWLEQSQTWREGFTTYSHPVDDHGHWTLGGSLGPDDTRWELGAGTVTERSRRVVTSYVSEFLDGIEPEVVDVLPCTHMPRDGDGFEAARAGPVLAIWGDNLFKFAPVLGSDLARAATTLSTPHQGPSS
jgi:sarcosine oxidase